MHAFVMELHLSAMHRISEVHIASKYRQPNFSAIVNTSQQRPVGLQIESEKKRGVKSKREEEETAKRDGERESSRYE